MRYLFFLTFFVYPFLTRAQQIITFNDTVFFQILERNDTLDIDGNIPTPYPSSVELDLNCDGLKDIVFNCYTTPVQNFPSAHHIEIQNLLGAGLEFLNDGSYLNAFRVQDTIHVDSTDEWISKNSFRLFYFHVLGGASWAGVNSTDSTSVNNMYLVFRIKENNGYKYGWINYSGQSWPTKLFIHRTAFSKADCLQTHTTGGVSQEATIRIFPNPFENHVNISIPDFNYQNIKWRIFSVDNVLKLEGEIKDSRTDLALGRLLDNSGIYLLQILMDEQIIQSQILIKI